MADTVIPSAIPCPSGLEGHMGTLRFRRGTYSFYRCQRCAHLWIHPIPTEAELLAFYDKGYFHGDTSKRGYADYDRDKQSVAKEFAYCLDRIRERLGRSGRLLDVGAATGFFLRMAAERGWQGCGVELSEHAASVAQQRGLDVVQGTLEQHADRFRGVDVVTLWDVVEHVRDPFALFHTVRSIIAPDGLVMFYTPQSDSLFARAMGKWWTLIAPPQHIHYFSLTSIKDALHRAGFEFLGVEWHGKHFTISYIIHFVMGWLGLKWNWLSRIAAWEPFTRWNIRINPRDMMIVTARPR